MLNKMRKFIGGTQVSQKWKDRKVACKDAYCTFQNNYGRICCNQCEHVIVCARGWPGNCHCKLGFMDKWCDEVLDTLKKEGFIK
jgi:hypothetical protein